MSAPLLSQIVRAYVDVPSRQIFNPISGRAISTMEIVDDDTLGFQFALCESKVIQPLSPEGYPLIGTTFDVSSCTFKLGIKTMTQYRTAGAYTASSTTPDMTAAWTSLADGRVQFTIEPNVDFRNFYYLELAVITASKDKITPFLSILNVIQK